MTEETTATPPAAAPASDTPETPTLVQKLSAEVIGTFILVLFGCGAAVTVGGLDGGTSGFVGTVGLAFGLAIVVTVYAFGRISGGHFNPAVSIGAAIGGRIAWVEAGYYVVAQLVGAIIGALVLFISTHGIDGYDVGRDGLGQNSFGHGGFDAWSAFLAEMIMTAVFVFIILSVTDSRNEHPALAPLAIGLTLAAIHFVLIPLTGTSVNPARSIGPALFVGADAIKQLWLFILAPGIGGLIAGLAYPVVFGRAEEPVPGSGFDFGPKQAPSTPEPTWGAGPDQYQQQWGQQTGGQQTGGEHLSWGQQPPAAGAAAPAAQQPAQAAQQQPQQPQQPATGAEAPSEQTQVSGGQGWQQPVQPAAEGELPVYEQDGWRWDYAKQQWVPIDQSGDQSPS